MSNDKPPKDAKTALEEQLVRQAAAPWNKVLGDDEREGMRIFLNLFVKTHPEMQKMVSRRVAEDAAAKGRGAGNASKEGPTGAAPPTLEEVLSGATERIVDASGVVARDPRDEGETKDKKRSSR